MSKRSKAQSLVRKRDMVESSDAARRCERVGKTRDVMDPAIPDGQISIVVKRLSGQTHQYAAIAIQSPFFSSNPTL